MAEPRLPRVQLDEIESRILAYIDSSEGQSHTQEIAEATGITRHTASKYLSVLEAKGMLAQEQVGNAKVWYPIEDDLQIRKLTLDDRDDLVNIADTIKGGGDEYQRYIDNVEQELQSRLENTPTDFCLGAVSDEHIVGFIIGEQNSWEFGSTKRVGWIRIIGVAPEYQGRGVGRMLIDELLKRFNRAGVEEVQTIVNWDEIDLLSFFSKHGFNMSEATVIHKSTNDGEKA